MTDPTPTPTARVIGPLVVLAIGPLVVLAIDPEFSRSAMAELTPAMARTLSRHLDDAAREAAHTVAPTPETLVEHAKTCDGCWRCDITTVAPTPREDVAEQIAQAIEALPVRHCHEDPTGATLVNVSRHDAVHAARSFTRRPDDAATEAAGNDASATIEEATHLAATPGAETLHTAAREAFRHLDDAARRPDEDPGARYTVEDYRAITGRHIAAQAIRDVAAAGVPDHDATEWLLEQAANIEAGRPLT